MNLNRLATQPLMSAGLGLGVLSALVAMFAPGGVIARGPGRGFDAGSRVTVDLPGPVLIVFVVIALLFGAALAIPQMWAKVTGIGLLWAATITYAFMVIVARSNDRFPADADLTLGRAGWVLAGAFAVAATGLVLALVGARTLAGPPAVPVDAQGNALTGPRTSGHATAALVLGLCSVLAPICSALAVAFSALAFRQIGLSNGHRTGRGMAIAGLVLGIVMLSLVALFLVAGVFVASPSADG